MKRRTFLSVGLLGTAASASSFARWYYRTSDETSHVASTRFSRIMNASQMGQWAALPIGERMIRIANHFVDVPYVGGTLEGDPEQCRLDFEGLDCVTFFELTLGIARMIGHGGTTIEDLRKEVEFTRYRSGKLVGYESRLHYTADWIADNVVKKVVVDVTPQLDGKPLHLAVNFMSTHPQYYKPLQEHPELIPVFAKIEQHINAQQHLYIPKDDVAKVEDQLQSGDIVAIVTNKVGLDYAHTGLINVVDGQARFMHASSTQKKVVLDATISEYLKRVSSHTGVTIVRPI
ncbi:MAG: DUF1460 domain-containing protein [Bradyrhizobiaceae bacterium]|nr:DUF1460 domain-containing protein [Bradyrhizobiaceae bacterium]